MGYSSVYPHLFPYPSRGQQPVRSFRGAYVGAYDLWRFEYDPLATYMYKQ